MHIDRAAIPPSAADKLLVGATAAVAGGCRARNSDRSPRERIGDAGRKADGE
jgi:hypothetical protein